ncbi:TonB-dependent siderophore receptor [Reyranella sp.]|uniref:TonB-dependent siderophore receptor n=1 Tax=Reyranella sp. TaxID=1929291 RepID=UPI003BAC367F
MRAIAAARHAGAITLILLAGVGPLVDGRSVLAQEAPAAGPASRVRSFDIGAQSLADALAQFGRQSGLQVSVHGDLVRGLTTPGVNGTMSSQQALSQLLAGTGLVFSISGGGTVTLQKPGAGLAPGIMQLDPVQVQGNTVPTQAMIDNIPPPYAGGQVATGGQLGLLGNRDVMDTPFNQTSYTAKKAQDQQASTVRDVLIDDPSIRSYFHDGSAGVDAFRIRGFPVTGSSGMTYGGLYGMLPYTSVMAEMAERIEVLKGPSALLNGMSPAGNIGGTVNVVPKRAPDEPLTQATASYGSTAQFGGHVDLARRFGDEKQFGVRFNGVFRAGETAVANNTDERALGVLGLDFRGEHVRLSADLGYQYQYIGGQISYLSLAAGVPLPWAPNARTNQGQPWNYMARKDLFGVIRAEVDLTERITAYAAFGAHDNRLLGLYSITNTITNVNGAATATAPVNRSWYTTELTADGGVRALTDTGPIGHEFALTATTYEYVVGNGSVPAAAFATNIYNPTIVAQPNLPMPASNKVGTQSLSGLAIADTLSAADKRIQLTAGLRLQNVTSTSYNFTTGKPTSGYDQSALTPAVALVFKPWENVTFYGNFIQGLQPGSVVGTTFANAGEIFPPFVSTQYEAGVKVDWGKFTTTASLFQITQPSLLTDVATNTQYMGGQQRNQGLELNVFGEPLPGVRLLGGAMFLNPVLTQTQGGTTDGWIAPMSPQLNVNLSGEWDLPFVPGLTLNGRVVYTGSQYIDTLFPRRSLPAWTRFDLGARYAFDNPAAKGKLLVARLNVENVLDANYWAGGFSASTLSLGAPRTFRLSLTADF